MTDPHHGRRLAIDQNPKGIPISSQDRSYDRWVIGDGLRVPGADVRDDRGSDSTEKAFMTILAITLGTAVTVAAVAFVATKTALFK